MNFSSKNILVIGSTSKIARHFIQTAPASYTIYGACSRTHDSLLPPERQFQVDLSSKESVASLLADVAHITFDTVLFFAASYGRDPEEDYFAAYQKSVQMNAASSLEIARNIHLAKRSKLFFFGDAGLLHPKKGFTAYSLSKFAVADIARLLAVELAPHTSTFCLQLGPTVKEEDASPDYYQRGLLEIDSPVEGLVNLLHFLSDQENFNATGCVINYDGGAYLRRA